VRKLNIALATILGACTMQSSAGADDLIDLYKYLHANPELSLMETKTAAYLSKRFIDMGFDVTEKVGGTGVVAILKNGDGPTVMIRADMDGLPVKEQTGLPYASKIVTEDLDGNEVPVMHACGHDIHMTVLMGTAENMLKAKDQWSGTLMMILQPAEEISHGAKNMLADGLFERFPRPDYNLALHDNAALAAGQVGIVPGFSMASVDSVDISIPGVGGHGAYPHTTKDPVVLAARIVTGLQTIVSRETSPLHSAVVTVGSIHGGTKHNITPDEVKLQLTVRSYEPEVRDSILNSIRRIAKGSAEAYGMPEDKMPVVSLKNEHTPPAYNNPELAASMTTVIGQAIGEDNVKQLQPVMAGEDFGRYAQVEPKIPSLLFWLGAVNPDEIKESEKNGTTLPGLHSPFFAPDAEPTLKTGVTAMTAAALNLLSKE